MRCMLTGFFGVLVAFSMLGCMGSSSNVSPTANSTTETVPAHLSDQSSSATGEVVELAVSDTLRASNSLLYLGTYSDWFTTELGQYPIRTRFGARRDFFGDLQHGVELFYGGFHSGLFGVRGLYTYQGKAGGVSTVDRLDGSFIADRDADTFIGNVSLTANFYSSFRASLSGRYTPVEGVVRPFSFDNVSVSGFGNLFGHLDYGSGGILDSDLDIRFGDGLDHVFGVFAGEQPSGFDTVVFSGWLGAWFGPAPTPPEPEPTPAPPATRTIAATLNCGTVNVCRGDNIDADDVRHAWNDPASLKRALALAEASVDENDQSAILGLANRLGRFTPPLQSISHGRAQYYLGDDGFQYHFGRAGGAGSLDIELDFSGAGSDVSSSAMASMRRAAKLWSWTLADDGRSWVWTPSIHGTYSIGEHIVSLHRQAGSETGVVIAIAEPTRVFSPGQESTIGVAKPSAAFSTATTYRAKTGVLWLTSRLTDAVGSGDSNSTAEIISTTAHEIGHILGHANGIPAFDRHVIGNRFHGPNAVEANFGRSVILQDDGAHVDSCFSIMGYCHELGFEKDAWVYRPNRVDVALLTDLGYERFDARPSSDRVDDANDFEAYSWSAWGDWASWGTSAWRTLAFDVVGELDVTDELTAYADYFGLTTHEPLTARARGWFRKCRSSLGGVHTRS